MKRAGWIGATLSAALASGAFAAGSAQEADLLRAGSLARSGRCDEALVLLAKTGVQDAQASLLRGQCHVEGRRWAEAITALDEAQRLDPQLAEIQLPLMVARYEVGDLEGARRALDAMPPSATQRPEYHLYRGLLLLQDAENAQAGAAFDRARELAPSAMEPAATYYSGVAWLSAQDRARANAAFERVIAIAPGSEWAKQAEAARGSATRTKRRPWGWVRVGAEWDSNVILRGEGVDVPGEIGDESDGRAVWIAHGGAELFRSGAWSGGLSGTYYGSAHLDLTDFDEHHPTLSPWIDYRVNETTLFRVRYDVGYAWIDGDDFLFDQQVMPMLLKDWGEAGQSQFAVHVAWLDYEFPTSSPIAGFPGFPAPNYRDRDGVGYGFTAQHAYPLSDGTDLVFGAGYLGFAADGREYDFNGVDVFGGIETRLPAEIELRAVAGVGWLPFSNPSSYPDPPGDAPPFTYESDDREDVAFRFRIELERALGAGFWVMGRYRYQNRSSNVAVFDYDRHVVGLYVTYGF
jgi:tetratricopeptide (TPR) repeat protein